MRSMLENQLIGLLKDYSKDAPEVYEVMMYIIHSDTVMMAAEGANINNAKAVQGVPPESLMLMDQYASGMVRNKFYHENYAAISIAVARDHIRSKVLFSAAMGADKGLSHGEVIARDLIANRYDALGTVVFCHLGYSKCYEFELRFRAIIKASPEEIAMTIRV